MAYLVQYTLAFQSNKTEIRHGVRIRDRGVVWVSLRRTENGHEITIWDSRKGFDPETIGEMDGMYIGVRTVRERIKENCDGTF